MEVNKPICQCDEEVVRKFCENFEELDSYIKLCQDCNKNSLCETFEELKICKNNPDEKPRFSITVQCVVPQYEEDSIMGYWGLIKKGARAVLKKYT